MMVYKEFTYQRVWLTLIVLIWTQINTMQACDFDACDCTADESEEFCPELTEYVTWFDTKLWTDERQTHYNKCTQAISNNDNILAATCIGIAEKLHRQVLDAFKMLLHFVIQVDDGVFQQGGHVTFYCTLSTAQEIIQWSVTANNGDSRSNRMLTHSCAPSFVASSDRYSFKCSDDTREYYMTIKMLTCRDHNTKWRCGNERWNIFSKPVIVRVQDCDENQNTDMTSLRTSAPITSTSLPVYDCSQMKKVCPPPSCLTTKCPTETSTKAAVTITSDAGAQQGRDVGGTQSYPVGALVGMLLAGVCIGVILTIAGVLVWGKRKFGRWCCCLSPTESNNFPQKSAVSSASSPTPNGSSAPQDVSSNDDNPPNTYEQLRMSKIGKLDNTYTSLQARDNGNEQPATSVRPLDQTLDIPTDHDYVVLENEEPEVSPAHALPPKTGNGIS